MTKWLLSISWYLLNPQLQQSFTYCALKTYWSFSWVVASEWYENLSNKINSISNHISNSAPPFPIAPPVNLPSLKCWSVISSDSPLSKPYKLSIKHLLSTYLAPTILLASLFPDSSVSLFFDFLTAITMSFTLTEWMREGWGMDGWVTLSEPEPVTGLWVYTEAVYLFCLFACLFVRPSVHPSVSLSVRLSVCPTAWPSDCLTFRPSFRLSSRPSIS